MSVHVVPLPGGGQGWTEASDWVWRPWGRRTVVSMGIDCCRICYKFSSIPASARLRDKELQPGNPSRQVSVQLRQAIVAAGSGLLLLSPWAGPCSSPPQLVGEHFSSPYLTDPVDWLSGGLRG
jgi:hypothetical protein